jgi:signal transduction histidine kinase
MKKNLFHNASIKLTTIYVSIILCVSLLFSVWLYNVSLREIQRSVHRPPGPIEQLLLRENSSFAQELFEAQTERVERARNNLLVQFFILNASIAVAGGAASYFLARRSLKPIEEAHEAQSRFTADASHELRTPIAAMRIENEIALSDPSLSVADAREQLASTIEELDKLTALTEGMLKMARLESEALERAPEKIKTIIDAAVEKVTPLATQKKQSFVVGKIPDKKVLVHNDSVTDAVVVLLDNAVKYSPENARIKIITELEGKKVIIKVIDEGEGIPEEDLPHIFERFYRADSSRTKNSQKGFGLGLSIAQSIIEANAGSLTAKNTVKKGACFTVQLPLS